MKYINSKLEQLKLGIKDSELVFFAAEILNYGAELFSGINWEKLVGKTRDDLGHIIHEANRYAGNLYWYLDHYDDKDYRGAVKFSCREYLLWMSSGEKQINKLSSEQYHKH